MWTETTRRQYRRQGLRYASDVTDEEWALIEAAVVQRIADWIIRATPAK